MTSLWGASISGRARGPTSWKARHMRLAELRLIASLALCALVAPAAAEDRPAFCKEARQRVASDIRLAAAVKSVFGRVKYTGQSYRYDSDCTYPLKLLRFGATDVLITSVTGGFYHCCGARLSAYTLQRRNGKLRVLAKDIDFTEAGFNGLPGELTQTRFAGENAMVNTAGSAWHGHLVDYLRLFVFRGGRVVELEGDEIIALSEENDASSAKGKWAINGDKLVIDYRIANGGKTRNERVVWGLHGDRLRVEQGRNPPELGDTRKN